MKKVRLAEPNNFKVEAPMGVSRLGGRLGIKGDGKVVGASTDEVSEGGVTKVDPPVVGGHDTVETLLHDSTTSSEGVADVADVLKTAVLQGSPKGGHGRFSSRPTALLLGGKENIFEIADDHPGKIEARVELAEKLP